jgi:hypothetical protein
MVRFNGVNHLAMATGGLDKTFAFRADCPVSAVHCEKHRFCNASLKPLQKSIWGF